jgi:hypothetical protein
MNGLHISQVFISGCMIGFVYDVEHDQDDNEYQTILISFFIIGIKIVWW